MMIIALLALLLIIAFLAYAALTNPFSRFSVVDKPFRAYFRDSELVVSDSNRNIKVSNGYAWQLLAWAKLGLYIVCGRYFGSTPARASSAQAVAKEIIALRYHPRNIYLISGDHYVASYPRGIGTFNYASLDASIPCSAEEWQNKQLVYLETVGYLLGVFAKKRQLYTTVVPTGRQRVTCINSYSYPSDTLYALLFALAALMGLEPTRPFEYGKPQHVLQTKAAARALLDTYMQPLTEMWQQYQQEMYSEETGMVRQDRHYSGVKDIARRKGTLYDNVIYWKTHQLAQALGLTAKDSKALAAYKKRIMAAFWLEAEGHFLEDLTPEAKKLRYYSSDWLIVLATGFLDPLEPHEQAYFTRTVEYITAHAIDRPFAIKYQQERRAKRLYWVTRLAVSSYGGDSVWSFWGMEYIKVLLALYRATKQPQYLQQADFHIAHYRNVMERDRGFPEVFDRQGKLLQTLLYRSVRQTSWVVGFEQVLAIRQSLEQRSHS